MNGMRDSFPSSGDDEEDEELFDAVVAISHDGDFYFDYEDIPSIPSPSFLMVTDGGFIADRWIIDIRLRKSFLEFVSRIFNQWNDNTYEGRGQMCAFVEALEYEVLRLSENHSLMKP
jgi:hypothetical protein